MKKVIDGKMYNTETAKKLGEFDNGRYGDHDYMEEALYLTKSGAYFLYGTGGAMSKYAEASSNSNWTGGSIIQSMSLSAAKEWAEKNLTGDEYEDIFGEIEEDGDEKEQLKAYVSPTCKRILNNIKQETGKTIGQIIEEKFME